MVHLISSAILSLRPRIRWRTIEARLIHCIHARRPPRAVYTFLFTRRRRLNQERFFAHETARNRHFGQVEPHYTAIGGGRGGKRRCCAQSSANYASIRLHGWLAGWLVNAKLRANRIQ